MIEITLAKDDGERRLSLTVKGHAGYGEKGRDVVCAAVSILTYTLAKNVDTARERGESLDASIRLDEGDAHILCTAGDPDDYRSLLRVFCVIEEGYALLAESYPHHVTLTSFGQA